MSETIEKINALADDQLSGDELREARALIDSDPAARREFEWALEIKRLMPIKCEPLADEDGWLKAIKRFDDIDAANRSEHFVGRYAWAMCAFFLIAILTASFINRNADSRALSTADMASIFSFGGGRSEVVDEPSQAKRLLEQAVGNAPVSVRERAFEVVSFAQGTIDGRRAARLDLEDGRGSMALFVVEDTWRIDGTDGSQQRGPYELGAVNGQSIVTWTDGGYGLLLIGERPHEGLCSIAEKIRFGE